MVLRLHDSWATHSILTPNSTQWYQHSCGSGFTSWAWLQLSAKCWDAIHRVVQLKDQRPWTQAMELLSPMSSLLCRCCRWTLCCSDWNKRVQLLVFCCYHNKFIRVAKKSHVCLGRLYRQFIHITLSLDCFFQEHTTPSWLFIKIFSAYEMSVIFNMKQQFLYFNLSAQQLWTAWNHDSLL